MDPKFPSSETRVSFWEKNVFYLFHEGSHDTWSVRQYLTSHRCLKFHKFLATFALGRTNGISTPNLSICKMQMGRKSVFGMRAKSQIKFTSLFGPGGNNNLHYLCMYSQRCPEVPGKIRETGESREDRRQRGEGRGRKEGLPVIQGRVRSPK